MATPSSNSLAGMPGIARRLAAEGVVPEEAARKAAFSMPKAAAALWPWSPSWWLDPVIGLAVAGVAVWQGFRSWRGEDCGC